MQNATVGTAVTASNAAAVAVTLRVLQLASTASNPALPPGHGQQMLQSINSAARQAPPDNLGVLAACLAETIAFQDATGSLVQDHTNLMLLASACLRLFLLTWDTCLLPYIGRKHQHLIVQARGIINAYRHKTVSATPH